MNSLLEAALGYCRRGFSVIPVEPNGKRPVFSWTEYSQRRATEDEIQKWWKENPNYNIAIITGEISDIVAVDIDTDRGGNASKVYDIAPTDTISQTGSGGYHLIYRYNDRIAKNKVGKDGIDIRSNGGYIVVPPSVHNSGNRYKWVRSNGIGFVTSSLVSYINTPQNIEERPLGDYDKWIVDALMGVGQGGRNDTCAKLAGYYAGKGIPKDVARELLNSWNVKNDPPMDTLELNTTIDSVYKISYRHNPVNATTTAATEAAMSFDIVPMSQYMKEYGAEDAKWIIADWLPEDTIAFVNSPPGTYKTWMLLDLAISVATGTNFLGQFEVQSRGPVLLIQQEDAHGGLAERMGIITNTKYEMYQDGSDFSVNLPPEIPLYIHPDRKLRFNNALVMDKLEEVVNQLRPKLVLIDPLYSAAQTDDYMAKSAAEMFRLKEMRDKYGCSFVIAHHKKKGSEGNDREGLWGSQFLNAFLETGWQIRKIDETTVVIRRHFKVKKEMLEVRIRFDINTEGPPYGYNVDVEVEIDENHDNIVTILGDNPMSVTELAKATGLNKSTISRRLKLMEADGIVVRVEGGKKFRTLEGIKEF